mgnify:CR=1 FL=1
MRRLYECLAPSAKFILVVGAVLGSSQTIKLTVAYLRVYARSITAGSTFKQRGTGGGGSSRAQLSQHGNARGPLRLAAHILSSCIAVRPSATPLATLSRQSAAEASISSASGVGRH